MSDLQIQSVLSQLRALQARAAGVDASQGAQAVGNSAKAAGPGGFGELMTRAIGEVNHTQQAAAAKAHSFELGEGKTSLSDVMLSSARAQLSFNAMTQVRNRLVRAYQEVMNMPI